MAKVAWAMVPVAVFCVTVRAQQTEHVESIYAPPEIIAEEQGGNEGPVTIDLRYSYLTDYVWRGIDRSESGGTEDSPNVQFDGSLHFDLGKLPHLFLGAFTNIYDSDPASRFQEIRPYFGMELTARPIIFAVGHTNYIFPDRDIFNTAELWGRLRLDDSYFFRTDEPIFNPYVLVAWDYDVNGGIYAELGISHDFTLEDVPLTLTPRAAVALVDNHKAFRTGGAPAGDPGFSAGTTGQDSGFQHYEVGVELTYTMNDLLNIPDRYGKIDFKGYLFYTDGLENELRADTGLWGGVGIGFSY